MIRFCTKSDETHLNPAIVGTQVRVHHRQEPTTAKRYELPDAARDLVADIFSEPRRNGRPRIDDRLIPNGVLWVLCPGAAWRDMAERFFHEHSGALLKQLGKVCDSTRRIGA